MCKTAIKPQEPYDVYLICQIVMDPELGKLEIIQLTALVGMIQAGPVIEHLMQYCKQHGRC